ncbi:nucleotidyltransferase family protein [Proteiniphilum sp. X52]|uniref:nucleotidyltransferase family protein n=1 Tax=Proteiniphilum sp. X52 TaxID=2382159 RepID=UPI000F0A0A1A|nr:nucleotidyltransferase family protein [Proteiniphilum sp. X52]RNC66230.1 nucleotidyltransferase family protein [Proteiniphilum sp. X52]
MKAMIFAAGLGTRLKPLTDTMPKALVPIGGKPLLQHAIEKLKAAGFDEIIINAHHFAGQIIDFVEANRHFGIHIEFSDEREKLLDTGGGIKKASPFFNDNKPFLVHNVDILSNIDLRKLYEAHARSRVPDSKNLSAPPAHAGSKPQPAQASPSARAAQPNPLGTLVCNERKTTRYLLFDGNNRLKGWINEKTGEVKSPFPGLDPRHYRKLAFAGIQILQPSIFQYMAGLPDRFPIIEFYLSICDKEELTCYIPDNLKLVDVGKTDSLEEAAQFSDTLF